MKRGEVWRVQTVAMQRLVLIVQSDALAAISPGFLAAPLYEQAPPTRTLIAPPVQGAYADLSDTGRLLANRFVEHVATASNEEMADVAIGLKAVFDLD
ncbi:MAG TPA: type II toxin-antitoxin system PemK/MazF family toxin [Candidatus Limnocylindrales bacterium]|nr:type II toxin-antitoxin system PemK/MazF family toxin [Candidatus Limnocylindrales bacterium]